MYAKGMYTRYIEEQMWGIHGIDVSPSQVSRVTDKIMTKVAEWRPASGESLRARISWRINR